MVNQFILHALWVMIDFFQIQFSLSIIFRCMVILAKQFNKFYRNMYLFRTIAIHLFILLSMNYQNEYNQLDFLCFCSNAQGMHFLQHRRMLVNWSFLHMRWTWLENQRSVSVLNQMYWHTPHDFFLISKNEKVVLDKCT